MIHNRCCGECDFASATGFVNGHASIVNRKEGGDIFQAFLND